MRGDKWVGWTFVRFREVGYGADGYGCFWNIIMSVTGSIKIV